MQTTLRSTRPLARLAFVAMLAFAATGSVASIAAAQEVSAAATSPSGAWRITGTTPEGIEYVSDVDLAVSAENGVTGTITLPRMGMSGTVAGTFEPANNMLQVTLRFPAGDGEMAIPAELLLEGDTLRGDGEGMEGATIAFTGIRLTAEMLEAEAAAAEAAISTTEAMLVEAAASASRTPLSDAIKDASSAVLEFNEHVTVLASPWMEGRLPGTRGMELAREYMEWQFIKAGLVPAIPIEGSEAKSFRQPFPLGSNDIVSNQRLEAMVEDAVMEFTLGEDYEFTGMGTAGDVEAPVVFVGYSIEEGENGYTSFREDEDLSGKIALMLRFEPMDDEGGSQWSERGWSSNASFQRKFAAVSRRNPFAVILVNPPGANDPRASELIKRGTKTAEFPVVMMTPEAADRMVRLIDAEERSLMDLRRLADEGEPSFDFIENARVSLAAQIDSIPVTAENVVGLLPGRGGLENEYIVIGGHLDHLGFGDFGSRRGAGNLHPGADDNASGSAGVMMLGKSLKQAYDALPPETPLRSILFMGFDAEESGLNGARHYVRNPIAPISTHSLMMNFDMIGRIENRRLSVSGLGSGEGLKEWAQPFFEASELEVVQNDGGGGGSDHAAFNSAGVPNLFAIIADFHGDYHTPDDTPEKLNREDAVRAIELWHELALAAAQRPEKFVQPAGAASGDRARGNRLSVRFGVRSRPVEGGEGLEVVSVSDGSSAADAGILEGDVILLIDKEAVGSREELVAKLRDKSPGDVMSVTILRDAEEQLLYVTLKGAD
ncbi:MAG: M28 family peptidase [Phycisphaerales bacterium]